MGPLENIHTFLHAACALTCAFKVAAGQVAVGSDEYVANGDLEYYQAEIRTRVKTCGHLRFAFWDRRACHTPPACRTGSATGAAAAEALYLL